MQVRFIVYDMKCAVGRKGVFYEVFQMAADIGRVRMYSGHPPPYRQGRSAVPILKGAEAGLIKKRWMHSMRIWLPEKVQMISWRVR